MRGTRQASPTRIDYVFVAETECARSVPDEVFGAPGRTELALESVLAVSLGTHAL
jgi:hypothetical protein